MTNVNHPSPPTITGAPVFSAPTFFPCRLPLLQTSGKTALLVAVPLKQNKGAAVDPHWLQPEAPTTWPGLQRPPAPGPAFPCRLGSSHPTSSPPGSASPGSPRPWKALPRHWGPCSNLPICPDPEHTGATGPPLLKPFCSQIPGQR